MVSWGDGEDSSTNLSATDTEGRTTMYDSDYNGAADDGDAPIRCKCGAVANKFVAFEGCWTGRRFLACAGQFGETCEFVRWVDDVWPDSLCKSLSKLWEMYSDMKDARIRDAFDHCEAKFSLKDEITKLHMDLRNAQDELKQVVEEKQVTLALKAKAEQALIDARVELEEKKKVDACTSNMHKCLRVKAEKDRDKCKEEKRKLECMIAELLKKNEGTRAKIRKIKELCDE